MNLGSEDTSSPYSLTWDTTSASNGTHIITAVARDAAGNTTTSSSVSVTVSNTISSVTAEPSYTGSDKLIAVDNFDSYTAITGAGTTFTSRYPIYRVLDKSDSSVPISNLVSLVSGRTGNAVRLSYGGANGASDIIVGTEGRLDSIGQWNGTLPEVAGPYSHFLFTTWIRFSPGADPGADPIGSGVKGVMFWHTGNQRYQHSPHRLMDYVGGRYNETHWDVGPPHPPNSTTGLNHWKTFDGRAPTFAPYADGNWHRFTTEVYAGNPTHQGERWWLDGVLVFDNVDNVGNLNWGTDYTYTYPITHWMVFGNYARGTVAAASPAFTVDFDDWTAWTN